ncbi:MAG: 2'-deoxycytidine 5'-triphosphate deaminase domain-containing protein, partial [Alphaproteobacteria bacterium]
MAHADQKPLADLVPASGGILPCQAIERLIEEDVLKLAQPAIEGQIQPASLDLRLGVTAYRVRASFLPGPDVAVDGKLKQLALHEIDLQEGAVLEVGCVYLVPLLESLRLPLSLSAACNPKSSTGRLDVFTRVITDGCSAFDTIKQGYHGPLYAEICPQTFPVLVRTGSRL